MKLILLLILMAIYFGVDKGLTIWFTRRFFKPDNFIGKRAPDEVQRFFGRVVYLILVYYGVVFIYLATEFDFWGLVSIMRPLDSRVFEIVGLALSLACLALMAAARLNLGQSWRVGLDHATKDPLVTTGFYHYVRNPYFTFFMGFQLVLFLVVPTALMLFAFIQSALLLGLQVRQEEIFLEAKYGAQYAAYKQATGRFFPRLLHNKL